METVREVQSKPEPHSTEPQGRVGTGYSNSVTFHKRRLLGLSADVSAQHP